MSAAALLLLCDASQSADTSGREIFADVVALDQPLVYNRFGSFNPYGMIFALREDVTSASRSPDVVTAQDCGKLDGTEHFGRSEEALSPGKVRLRDCKRARPLTLRANKGDLLVVRVQNLLRIHQPDISKSFCNGRLVKDYDRGVPDPAINVAHGSRGQTALAHLCEQSTGAIGAKELPDLDGVVDDVYRLDDERKVARDAASTDWPATRTLSFVMQGLELDESVQGTARKVCSGLYTLDPGEAVTCRWRAHQEGTHLFSSFAAPSGGEGDSGSAIHGLFGALIIEPKDSRWFRSQVTQSGFDRAWPEKTGQSAPQHARGGPFDYDAKGQNGWPVLDMLKPDGAGADGQPRYRIVHGDLNAIIVPPAGSYRDGDEQGDKAFREFTIIFHDELKTFYAKNFQELEDYSQFSGIGDGFAINYGASGMGSLLLANRKGIGPAADCVECVYEEFFLQSWANGDPALREGFPDDPSNVHHSYLNDRVVFRNFHVGKETHVFHLHAHQWLAADGLMEKHDQYGSYLDSQTIGPQQGLTYKIYHPGMAYGRGLGDKPDAADPSKALGWWSALGSGNRNRTPGDAIFHCHLYPHFAQGMWALWRVHDVIEDGSRLLPDGQDKPGPSLFIRNDETIKHVRPGTSIENGPSGTDVGTPIPAVIPLPEYALPPIPSYGDKGFPGYPFYVPGEPGHRAPQPPLDIAEERVKLDPTAPEVAEFRDGGLPRHIVMGGGKRRLAGVDVAKEVAIHGLEEAGRRLTRRALALADFSAELTEIEVRARRHDGEPIERRAMAFHGAAEASGATPAQDRPDLLQANGTPMIGAEGSYPSLSIERGGAVKPTRSVGDLGDASNPNLDGLRAFAKNPPFIVNGAPPKPGAPFADPCGAPELLKRFRPAEAAKTVIGPDKRLRSIADRLAFDPQAHPFYPDPMLRGFRRYEASVIQLDLVVNKAGWHDPQGRINVLTREVEESEVDGVRPDQALKGAIRGDREPFFFRAHSGDCIEFRHTNETPLHLQRDDFQVKTPTDTIGQHIHLVKFDVTSADGSGNGWNYEDGTFAPGAIHERLCAIRKRNGGELPAGFRMLERPCIEDLRVKHPGKSEDELHKLYEEKLEVAHLEKRRDHFQTTVQRWFADPFLSSYRLANDNEDRWHDRSLRTVFTHDHFGASSIQQHGFYNALLIEPAGLNVDGSVWRSVWRKPANSNPLQAPVLQAGDMAIPTNGACPSTDAQDNCAQIPTRVAESKAVGSVSAILIPRPVGALAFEQALTKRKNGAAAGDNESKTLENEARIEALGKTAAIDAKNALSGPLLESVEHNDHREQALAVADFALLYDPAGDRHAGRGLGRLVRQIECALDRYAKCSEKVENRQTGTLFSDEDSQRVQAGAAAALSRTSDYKHFLDGADLKKLEEHRAAIHENGLFAEGKRLIAASGGPVAPPYRPEAISQKHHDPYLVNYRNEPIPLRLSGRVKGKSCPADHLDSHAVSPPVSIVRLAKNDPGDPSGASRSMLSHVFMSDTHGDPCTPIARVIEGERIQFRLIQGAQEVQHVFNIEGASWPRHVDEQFRHYKIPLDARRRLYANWPNPWGFVTGQEVGLSEHFEANLAAAAGGLQGPIPFVLPASAPDKILADALYHAGSSDALWNGALGLGRVFVAGTSTNSLRLSEHERGTRTVKLEQAAETPDIGRLAGAPILKLSGDTAQYCPVEAPRVYAYAMAIRVGDWIDGSLKAEVAGKTRTILEKERGLFHDLNNRLYDPDALALVHLDPTEVTFDGKLKDASGQAVKARLQAMWRRTGVEPYTLRVNAGDCLRWSVLNRLPATMPDKAGDALMPKITTLNVDDRRSNANGAVEPSSDIAFSLALTKLGAPDDVLGIPVGREIKGNSKPIEPGNARNGWFYAGLRLAETERIEALVRALHQQENGDGPPLCNAELARRSEIVSEAKVSGLHPARLRPRALCPLTPYALGPIPIKSIADVIGHAPHGLFGAVIVETEGSSYRGRVLGDESGTETPSSPMPDQACLPSDAREASYVTGVANKAQRAYVQANPTPPHQAQISDRIYCVHAKIDGDDPNAWELMRPAAEIKSKRFDEQALVGDGGGPTAGQPLAEARKDVLSGRSQPSVALGSYRTDGDVPDSWLTRDVTLREHTLFYQDGLNLWAVDSKEGDRTERDRWLVECHVCDDSYDLGSKGVSYRTSPFLARLAPGKNHLEFADRYRPGDGPGGDAPNVRSAQPGDLNAAKFPKPFFSRDWAIPPTPSLSFARHQKKPETSELKDDVLNVVHVLLPQGRARQRAFISVGAPYEDMGRAGAGSASSALVAPGKSVTAEIRTLVPGQWLWRDGPGPMTSGGVWGHVDVEP